MTLEDRRRDFENRYVHDQELKFRIEARRNKLAGNWAAEKLGKSGAEAEAYAQASVAAGFSRDGEEGVVRMFATDFSAAGVDQSEHQIRRHLAELFASAETQVNAR